MGGLSMSGRPKGSVLPQSHGCNKSSRHWETASGNSAKRRVGHKRSLLRSAGCIERTLGPLSAEKRTSLYRLSLRLPRPSTLALRGYSRVSPKCLLSARPARQLFPDHLLLGRRVASVSGLAATSAPYRRAILSLDSRFLGQIHEMSLPTVRLEKGHYGQG